jgi:hypothetical protein
LDHNIGFKKNGIFRLKLAKIAENCDHDNFTPRDQRSPTGVSDKLAFMQATANLSASSVG